MDSDGQVCWDGPGRRCPDDGVRVITGVVQIEWFGEDTASCTQGYTPTNSRSMEDDFSLFRDALPDIKLSKGSEPRSRIAVNALVGCI